MKPIRIKKLMIALLLVSATHIALGSFTGRSDRKNNKTYSLKNFNKNFYRSYSPYSLRAGFAFKGLQLVRQKREANGDITCNSIMQYERGNTTYIYPYTHKIRISKFVTPSAPAFR